MENVMVENVMAENLTGKKIIVFTGSSGAGKSFLSKELLPYGIPELISHTSRKIRLGEVEGVNYYFRTEGNILSIEMAESAKYGNDLYGISAKEMNSKLAQYDIVYAVTEMNGIKQLKAKYGDAVVVIYVQISPEEAEKRMIARKDNPINIDNRLKKAIRDKEYDNAKFADFVIDNNGSFENSKEQLLDIVFNKLKTAV